MPFFSFYDKIRASITSRINQSPVGHSNVFTINMILIIMVLYVYVSTRDCYIIPGMLLVNASTTEHRLRILRVCYRAAATLITGTSATTTAAAVDTNVNTLLTFYTIRLIITAFDGLVLAHQGLCRLPLYY